MNKTDGISFDWNLILECNYRCPYCWFDGKWDELKSKSPPQLKELIKYWTNIYRRYGSVHINILGGEPFLYPDFIELVKELSGIHRLAIQSNLSLDMGEFVKKIDSSKVSLGGTFHPMFAELDEFVKKASLLKDTGFTDNILYLAYPPQIEKINCYRPKFENAGLHFSVLTFWGKHKGVDYPGGYTDEEKKIIEPYRGTRSGEKFQIAPKKFKGLLCNAGHKHALVDVDGQVTRCGGSDQHELIGNLSDENFKLLDGPRACTSEHCPCNEWAFLLDKEEDSILKFLENKDINQKEIDEKRTILESKPLRLGIVITDKCNLDCIMCSPIRKRGHTILSRVVLEKIKELLPHLESINWQGGEIFYVKYLKEVFNEMSNYPHVEHEITTNGLLLDREWLEILFKLKLSLLFSIDSVVPKTYEYIRTGAKFKKLIEKLDLVSEMEQKHKKEIYKTIAVVVMKSNYRELELFVDFAKKYKFKSLLFLPVMGFEHEENIFNDMDLKITGSLARSMERIEKAGSNSNINIDFRLPGIKNKPKLSDMNSSGNQPELFCLQPWKAMWIDVSKGGGIFPDCMCLEEIGNIYKDSLPVVWNSKRMQEYRQRILKNEFLSFCNSKCTSGLVSRDHLLLKT